LTDISQKGFVSPGAAAIIDADGFVWLGPSGPGGSGPEGNLAKRDANVRVETAREINSGGIRQRVAAVRFERFSGRDHNMSQRLRITLAGIGDAAQKPSLRQNYLDQVQRVICVRKTLSLRAFPALAPRTWKNVFLPEAKVKRSVERGGLRLGGITGKGEMCGWLIHLGFEGGAMGPGGVGDEGGRGRTRGEAKGESGTGAGGAVTPNGAGHRFGKAFDDGEAKAGGGFPAGGAGAEAGEFLEKFLLVGLADAGAFVAD
jgi:hypothetical protein